MDDPANKNSTSITGNQQTRADKKMAQDMKRIGQQGEKIFGAGGFAGDGSDNANDPMEIWGRRIGRGLGIVFALYLIWHMLVKYVLPPS